MSQHGFEVVFSKNHMEHLLHFINRPIKLVAITDPPLRCLLWWMVDKCTYVLGFIVCETHTPIKEGVVVNEVLDTLSYKRRL